MPRGIASFYRECFSRAFRGRYGKVEKWTAGLSFFGLIAVALLPAAPEVERVIQVELPVYFFIGVFLLTVLAGFIAAPYEIYCEERDAKLALEKLREPKLHVMLPGPEPTGVALEGNTAETYGGMRMTTVTKWASTVFYLLCTNTGETEAKRCRARVLYATRISEDSEDSVESGGIIESIELAWSKNDPENHLVADIAPGDTVRIWLAYIRQNGSLWVFRNDLPVHYQRVFGDQGHHKILLQIDSDNAATTQLLISIQTEAATKPVGNGAWTPKATAEILGQGGPVLDHPDIPTRRGVA